VHAALEGVEGVSVRGDHVYVFDDVDLAVIWPVGALCPVGWPNRATKRHMNSIHDHETANSQRTIRQYLDAVSTKGRIVRAAGRVVHFDDDVPRRVHGSEALLGSHFASLVEDVAGSISVDTTIERPSIKEGRSGVILSEFELLAENHRSEGQKRGQAQGLHIDLLNEIRSIGIED